MMDIVRAYPEHAARLTEITILAKRRWSYPENWIQIWMPVLTISPQYVATHETWIAELDHTQAAYYSFNDTDEGLWLDNLFVLPDFMGQGIGQALFDHALERSQARGVSILKIESDPNARSFYEKMGARKVGEHHGEVDGHPRILPILEINL